MSRPDSKGIGLAVEGITMQKDAQRLMDMLRQGTISEDEYGQLSTALKERERREDAAGRRLVRSLIKPFEKFSPWQAAAIGLSVSVAMSLVAQAVPLHFPGIIGLQTAADLKTAADIAAIATEGLQLRTVAIGTLLLQTAGFSLLAGLLGFGLSLAFGARSVRIRDFIGSFLLGRYPYLAAAGLLAILYRVDASAFTHPTRFSPAVAALVAVSLLGVAWQVTVYFQAFKFSSGLMKTRLAAAFVITLSLTEVLAALAAPYYLS